MTVAATTGALCDDLVSFAEGELDEAAADAFRDHLTHCKRCGEELARALQLSARLSDLFERPAEPRALVVPAKATTALVAPAWLPQIFHRTCGGCWRALTPGDPYVRDPAAVTFPICLTCARMTWAFTGSERISFRYLTQGGVLVSFRDLERCPILTTGRTACRDYSGWWTSLPLRCVRSAGHEPGCVF